MVKITVDEIEIETERQEMYTPDYPENSICYIRDQSPLDYDADIIRIMLDGHEPLDII